MSLSRYLQSPDILATLAGTPPDALRSQLLDKGRQWFAANPAERAVIAANLAAFGIAATDGLLERIESHIVLHYFEKLLGLSQTPQAFADFLLNSIDHAAARQMLTKAHAAGRGSLLAMAHFGAVEFIGPLCAAMGLPVNVVLRFSTEQFSASVRAAAGRLCASGLFAPINIIELGKPGTMAALDMAAALRRGELLITVFDEDTGYSLPVTLFDRQVRGGAGLHKLITHAGASLALFGAFIVRTGELRYRFDLRPVEGGNGEDAIQGLFDALQQQLHDHLEQWYFLHEEVPFVKN